MTTIPSTNWELRAKWQAVGEALRAGRTHDALAMLRALRIEREQAEARRTSA